ncbi:MAG: DNRLRE domain-containing protein, partial [Bacillota bacterium]|nr:DNRLRE domain-containing protein [Bacillota bacterium]
MDNPVFKINLSTKDLEPKLDDKGIITFYDKDKKVFQIKTPFLYDSTGEENRNVVQKLEKQESGYLLTIELDKEWLNDSKRVYPVTLDPSVETSSYVQDISDAHVSLGYPNSNYYQSTILKTGYGSSSLTNRSYIKFTLPALKTGDMVTNARLYLALYTANSTAGQINVHKVNADWSSSTITWNNKPSYNSNIEDYDIVSGSSGSQFNWNITGIVKQWYTTGNNYGLMLKNNNESTGYYEYLSSDCSSSYATIRPCAVIYYINNSGLESYWTYHSQDMGRAGTGYVNDYNGNLILTHDDASLNGNKAPVSISHVYNSNDRAGSIGYGFGWRLNYSQRVVPTTFSDGQHYLYTDEDGTVQDFKSVSGIYKDQSGLDLTLTKNGDSTYTITDKKSNKLNFTSSGYLSTISDSNGNTLTLGYNGNVLKTIKDGADRIFILDTEADGRLSAINDPSGRKTSYTYTGDQLTKIIYPDGKYTTYTYDSDNKLLSATNYDGYRISYQYYAAAPYRISSITESNSDGTSGKDLRLTYDNNVTTFTDYRGRKNIYNFNYWGNTLGIKDNEGYAEYYKYGSASNTNKLTLQSKLQKTVTNYIQNHSAETVSNWISGTDGGIGSVSYSSDTSYMGQKSLKINKTDNVSRSYYSEYVTLEKGKTYTFSSYVKTSSISNSNNMGAYIAVHYKNSSDVYLASRSEHLTGTNDWTRLQVTFTLPSDSTSTSVLFRVGLENESGTAYFDCMQAEDGTIANRYNILENS